MNAPARSSHWHPRAGSLAERVLVWFCAHPDEELTAMDIAVKFGVSRPENVHGQLGAAVRAGRLARCAAQTPHLYRLPTREEAEGSAQPAPKPPIDIAGALRTARRLVQMLEQAQEGAR